jgi:uncharacterized protein (DUF58 family)
MDRVKRPLFLAFFALALVGLLAGQLVIFLGATFAFTLVGTIHLFMRRSTMPLLGNYLGIGRYLRVTREGKVLLALTVVIGLTAINARINLLLIVLGMLLGVVLISGVLSENSLRRVSVKLFLPSTAYAGAPFPARLTLRNSKKRLPSYSLHVEIYFEGDSGTFVSRSYVLKLPPDSIVTLEHMLNMDVRGRKTVRRVKIATRFPFGFFEKWSYHPVEAEVLLFPKLGRIPGRLIPVSNEYRNQGVRKVLTKIGRDEFWGIREYRDGDNPRHIHWRSSARFRKRLVREYHREESQNVCILLDAHVPDDAPELAERFESAVSFTATMAEELLDQDYQLSLAAYGQGLVKLTTDRGPRQTRRILTALAEIQPSRDKDLKDLVKELDPRLIADAFIVAVMLDGARERAARANLQRQRGNQLRVISVDAPAFRFFFEPPPAEGVS